MNQVIIGVGSNIDPWTNIESARQAIKADFQFIKESKFVETKPIGNPKQPDFVNGVILIATELPQTEVREKLRIIEDQLGRDRSIRNDGPRTIDLDIVIWNNEIVDPDVYEREFLREAIAKVCPEFKLTKIMLGHQRK